MRINDNTDITVFTSGRDDDHAFIGLKLESTACGRIDISTPPFTLEQGERLIQEIQEAQAYVDEFESMRGKQRRTMSDNHHQRGASRFESGGEG